MNTAALLWGVLFSSIGLGFAMYGRKQRKAMPLICGLALMLYPFFVSSPTLIVLVGVVLVALPYLVRI
jgi:hypothetical protein